MSSRKKRNKKMQLRCTLDWKYADAKNTFAVLDWQRQGLRQSLSGRSVGSTGQGETQKQQGHNNKSTKRLEPNPLGRRFYRGCRVCLQNYREMLRSEQFTKTNRFDIFVGAFSAMLFPVHTHGHQRAWWCFDFFKQN